MAGVKGKVALITGGASGIGEASARLLAAEGATVLVADVDAARGEQVASEIGAAAEFVALDVSSESDWQIAITGIVERHGRLDV